VGTDIEGRGGDLGGERASKGERRGGGGLVCLWMGWWGRVDRVPSTTTTWGKGGGIWLFSSDRRRVRVMWESFPK